MNSSSARLEKRSRLLLVTDSRRCAVSWNLLSLRISAPTIRRTALSFQRPGRAVSTHGRKPRLPSLRNGILTRPRLALALLLYTAQARVDVVGIGPQHNRGGEIALRRQKTGRGRQIPLHPELRKVLDATPGQHLTYLVTENGKPFTAAGFGNWFRDRCDEAGLSHCSAQAMLRPTAQPLALPTEQQLPP